MTCRSSQLASLLAALILIGMLAVTAAAGDTKPPAGDLVDLAMFGTQVNNGTDVCVEWDEPRDVRQLHVSGVSAEAAKSLELQWWGGTWPNGNREEDFPFGGGGGWQVLDDCYNGSWVRVAAEPVKAKDADVWVFTIPTLSKDEWNQYLDPQRYAAKKCPAFRRTFKIRVVSKANQPLPPALRIEAFSDSRWQEARFDVDFRIPQDGKLAGQINVANGAMVSLESLPAPRTATISGKTWTAAGSKGGSAGIRLGIRYVHNADGNSNDLTRVTVRLGTTPDAAGFSFVPEDVLAAGVMHLPDFGALVAPSEKGLSWANMSETSGQTLGAAGA